MTRRRSVTGDYVVDIGSWCRRFTAVEVVAQGAPADVMAKVRDSLTGQYLTGMRQIPSVPKKRRKGTKKQADGCRATAPTIFRR